MSSGMCSRRQKGFLQTGVCVLAVAFLSGGMYLYGQLQNKVKSLESMSLKFRQQQEALSAQLQVVYEHRSRLERSLQKERGEHKKTKEDFLVYKLEAQEALNKEKQDSMSRYGALSSQHKLLKNQHEDLKRQLQELRSQHATLQLSHQQVQEESSHKEALLQTLLKLKEESRSLRRTQDIVHAKQLTVQPAHTLTIQPVKGILEPQVGRINNVQLNQDSVTKKAEWDPGWQQSIVDRQVSSLKVNSKGLLNTNHLNSSHKNGADPVKWTLASKQNLGPGDTKLKEIALVDIDGIVDAGPNLPLEKKLIAQEPMMPEEEEEEEEEEEADPARDPNNQGEDEFEEAELEHPQTEGEQILSQQKETSLKGAGLENPLLPVTVPVGHQHAEDEYEEDQEIENDDNGGEVDEDLEVVQMKSVKKRGAAEERDNY
ncbi:Golgi integral membrane protein 4-like isoform X2 [Erpetoichthys calabaricus]|uniref:Golgi integral membrane protein 4-like isoform X2 n=1 Tax=Erpetoichthys calabaricus TaxID=27687 RepID=UPI002234D6A6|nr:Golgi integral membrane protein 4-like isoform X2 [Erpetoichthys calabaricus]